MFGGEFLTVDVLATIDERDQTNDLESEEKRIVRGATPEEELKAKQLSDKAHFRQRYKAIASLQGSISPQRHKGH